MRQGDLRRLTVSGRRKISRQLLPSIGVGIAAYQQAQCCCQSNHKRRYIRFHPKISAKRSSPKGGSRIPSSSFKTDFSIILAVIAAVAMPFGFATDCVPIRLHPTRVLSLTYQIYLGTIYPSSVYVLRIGLPSVSMVRLRRAFRI